MNQAEPVSGTQAIRPMITLRPGAEKRAVSGYPWVYSNEVHMTTEAKRLEPGSVVSLAASDGRSLGTWFFNPHPLISMRLLSARDDQDIDTTFFTDRLAAALFLRERLYSEPYYRLVHAEADRLPGLIIDRYGDVLAVQINIAGLERLRNMLIDALESILPGSVIVARNDTAGRTTEGLPSEPEVLRGRLQAPVPLIENGARFSVDLLAGQKTGWFFDQRDNRAAVAALAANATVLDVYSYAGGFAVQAAVAGASTVVAVDRSALALEAAERAARENGVLERCTFVKAEAFSELERLGRERSSFDIVVCDPPAFVKSKKDYNQGIKGYRKMARLAAPLVAPGGLFLAASCSHNVTVDAFMLEIRRGLASAGRTGRIIRSAGAAPDHPLHPALPESAYLKALLFVLD